MEEETDESVSRGWGFLKGWRKAGLLKVTRVGAYGKTSIGSSAKNGDLFEVWMLATRGEWCMAGMNGCGL